MITLDMIWNKWQRFQERSRFQPDFTWETSETETEPAAGGDYSEDNRGKASERRLRKLKALPAINPQKNRQ